VSKRIGPCLHHSPLVLLIPLFVVGAVAVWLAGIQLSNTTDVIDSRFVWVKRSVASLSLQYATNLPEIAMLSVLSLTHNIGIAIGNILGGIAIPDGCARYPGWLRVTSEGALDIRSCLPPTRA